MNESWHTYVWVMSRTRLSHVTEWTSHVTHTNEACHTCSIVMSHICMSHITHMNESCRTYEGVMSHKWLSYVTRIDESCRTYQSVISHMDESCCIYEWGMSHLRMSRVVNTNKLIERTRGGFLFTLFPDQEPCVRDFTTRCDRRISSWNLLHTALDQGTQ